MFWISLDPNRKTPVVRRERRGLADLMLSRDDQDVATESFSISLAAILASPDIIRNIQIIISRGFLTDDGSNRTQFR